ncbi:MAG: hypothetical protein HYR85_15610 [Planctomycetes bacterium]|nr:hypothetical protein [Planctomycetota bacterium]MBI3848140.1 hypothetical protein [Planctomycetota bacterium]
MRVLALATLPGDQTPTLAEVLTLRAGTDWMGNVHISDDGTRVFAASVWPATSYYIWECRPVSRIATVSDTTAAAPSAPKH